MEKEAGAFFSTALPAYTTLHRRYPNERLGFQDGQLLLIMRNIHTGFNTVFSRKHTRVCHVVRLGTREILFEMVLVSNSYVYRAVPIHLSMQCESLVDIRVYIYI